MSVTYNNNEIKVSEDKDSASVDVVYVKPDDSIKLDFNMADVKVSFVNGDVDFIFKNGSMISFASLSTLAFSDDAPKILDSDGNRVNIEDLLQKTQVLDPSQAVLILANRDESEISTSTQEINKVILSSTTDSELSGGNPIAGIGTESKPSKGNPSDLVDKTGTVKDKYHQDLTGEYLLTDYTSNLEGDTDDDQVAPGNSQTIDTPTLAPKFLYGDSFMRVGDVDGQVVGGASYSADYYAIQSGTGTDESADVQLNMITLDTNDFTNNHDQKVVDVDTADGNITRYLELDYGSNVFPQQIVIKNVPDEVTLGGYDIGVSNMVKNANGDYTITQLDPKGDITLSFSFPETFTNESFTMEYQVSYFDAQTGELKTTSFYQEVGIVDVTSEEDLSLYDTVISSSSAGVNTTTGDAEDIIIGGQVNNIINTKGGSDLVFTGGGTDLVDTGAGNDVVYGSTGYDVVSGGSGEDTIVFSNDASYQNLTSPVVTSDDFNTMSSTGESFYFGVSDSVALWTSLGYNNTPTNFNGTGNSFASYATSAFATGFDSITILDGVENIVGTTGADKFNLYFDAPQEVSINGGGGSGDTINLVGDAGDTITVDFSTRMITDDASASTKYSFDVDSFQIINGGDETDYFYVTYDAGRSQYQFNGGGGNNDTIDFSKVSGSSITFDAAGGIVTYYDIADKPKDVVKGFENIVGTTGDDTFNGSSASSSYNFDGGAGSDILTYEKSSSGVSLDFLTGKVYKVSNKDMDYGDLEHYGYDTYTNIETIRLSGNNDVIYMDSTARTVDGLGGTDHMDYSVDTTITSVVVDINAGTADKTVGGATVTDDFSNIESFKGTAGDDTFYGYTTANNNFEGVDGNDTLSYDKIDNGTSVEFVLSEDKVIKGSKTDTYSGIENLVGSKNDDTFSVGTDTSVLNDLNIDGNDGKDKISFADLEGDNPDTGYFLTYNVDTGAVAINDGDSVDNLTLGLTSVETIEGTLQRDQFIGSSTIGFGFDGNGDTDQLNYAALTSNLVIDLNAGTVDKGNGSPEDNFRNIEDFVTGTGDDTIYAYYRFGDANKSFDTGGGNDTISYAGVKFQIVFDLSAHTANINGEAGSIDTFLNVENIVGGDLNDIFVLSETPIDYNGSAITSINLDGGDGNDILDFTNTAVPLVEFDLSSTTYTTQGGMTYTWESMEGVKGTILDDSFVSQNTGNYIVDGNDGVDTVDYSQMAPEEKVSFNLITGDVSKMNDSTSVYTQDSLSNVENVILTDNDDTVVFGDTVDEGLSTLVSVDGKGGDNTLDFSQSTKTMQANITGDGFDITSETLPSQVAFSNFSTLKAGSGDSTFYVTDESDGANVHIEGNLSANVSDLDFSGVSSGVTYYNYSSLDTIADPNQMGLATWTGGEAHIASKNIEHVILTTNDDSIYASDYNNTTYVGGAGSDTAYYNTGDFLGGLNVTIGADSVDVYKKYSSGTDSYEQFENFHLSNYDDIIYINDLDALGGGITIDAADGNDQLNLKNLDAGVTYDYTNNLINGESIASTTSVENLYLTDKDDKLVIESSLVQSNFETISGGEGFDSVVIDFDTTVVFTEGVINIGSLNFTLGDGFEEIDFSKSTQDDNVIHGSLFYNLSYIGGTGSDTLEYDDLNTFVSVDFTNNTVQKGSASNVDTFENIENISGTTQNTDYFYLDDISSGFYNIDGLEASDGSDTDTVSFAKMDSAVNFNIATRSFDGEDQHYEWTNIETIATSGVDGTTFTASFNESYTLIGTTAANETVIYDENAVHGGAAVNGGYIVFDMNSNTVNKYDGSGAVVSTDTVRGFETIVGTENSDTFYASYTGMNYDGGENIDNTTAGEGDTLSYSSAPFSVTVTFAADNSGTVDKSISSDQDTFQNMERIEGTTGDDTFILADNTGSEVVTIDGGAGSVDVVDYSAVSTTSITLDTRTSGQLSNFNYKFENVEGYALTDQDDTVIGSVDNAGMGGGSLIFDGKDGNDTLDYSNLTANQSIYVDVGTTGKVSKTDTDNPSSGTVDSFKNFENIIGGAGNDNFVLSDSVGGDMNYDGGDGVDTVDFEGFAAGVNLTWDNNDISDGSGLNVVNFESITLTEHDDSLVINSTATVGEGAIINGGAGSNSITINGMQVEIDLQDSTMIFNGTTHVELDNFTTIATSGDFDDIVHGSDIFDYDIDLGAGTDTVDYSGLSLSGVVLNFSSLTEATVEKNINGKPEDINTDSVSNVEVFNLTDANDTIEVFQAPDGTPSTVTINAGGGQDTISFANAASAMVLNASDVSGGIQVAGYTINDAEEFELTGFDDTVNLSSTSDSIYIAGGAGKDTADYAQSGDVFNYSVSETGDATSMSIQVTKDGKQDTFDNFEVFKLGDGNDVYNASYSTVPSADYSTGMEVYFGGQSTQDTMNYKDMTNTGDNGINAVLSVDTDGSILAEVDRDKDTSNTSGMHDTLHGVEEIIGSSKDDDFTVDAAVTGAIIDGDLGTNTLSITYSGSDITDLIWDFNSAVVKTTDDDSVVSFTNVTKFVGADNIADDFLVTNTVALITVIGSGDSASDTAIDTVDFTDYISSSGNVFSVNFSSAGMDGQYQQNGTSKVQYSNIDTIIGTVFNDTFNLTIPSVTGASQNMLIDGSGGSNNANITLNTSTTMDIGSNFKVYMADDKYVALDNINKINVATTVNGVAATFIVSDVTDLGTYNITINDLNYDIHGAVYTTLDMSDLVLTGEGDTVNLTMGVNYTNVIFTNYTGNITFNSILNVTVNEDDNAVAYFSQGFNSFNTTVEMQGFDEINFNSVTSGNYSITIGAQDGKNLVTVAYDDTTFHFVNEGTTIIDSSQFKAETITLNSLLANDVVIESVVSSSKDHLTINNTTIDDMTLTVGDKDGSYYTLDEGDYNLTAQNMSRVDITSSDTIDTLTLKYMEDGDYTYTNNSNPFGNHNVGSYTYIDTQIDTLNIDLSDFTKESLTIGFNAPNGGDGDDFVFSAVSGENVDEFFEQDRDIAIGFNNTAIFPHKVNIIMPDAGGQINFSGVTIKTFYNMSADTSLTVDASESSGDVFLHLASNVGDLGASNIKYVVNGDNIDLYATYSGTEKDLNVDLIGFSDITGVDNLSETYLVESIDGVEKISFDGGSGSSVDTIKVNVDLDGGAIDLHTGLDESGALVLSGDLGDVNLTGFGVEVYDFSGITNASSISLDVTNFVSFSLYLPDQHTGDFSVDALATGKGGEVSFANLNGAISVTIDEDGNSAFTNSAYSGKTIVIDNVFNMTLTGNSDTIHQNDTTDSFIIDGYSGDTDTIWYNSGVAYTDDTFATEFTNNTTKNGDAFTVYKSGGGEDYTSNIQKIMISSTLSDQKVQVELNSGVTSDGTVSIDGEGSVFITVNGVSDGAIIDTNDIENINVTAANNDLYDVYYVDDAQYIDGNNQVEQFDTSGYYAIMDDQGNVSYVRGDNVEDSMFVDIDTDKTIDHVDSYDDLNIDTNDGTVTDGNDEDTPHSDYGRAASTAKEKAQDEYWNNFSTDLTNKFTNENVEEDNSKEEVSAKKDVSSTKEDTNTSLIDNIKSLHDSIHSDHTNGESSHYEHNAHDLNVVSENSEGGHGSKIHDINIHDVLDMDAKNLDDVSTSKLEDIIQEGHSNVNEDMSKDIIKDVKEVVEHSESLSSSFSTSDEMIDSSVKVQEAVNKLHSSSTHGGSEGAI